MSKLSRPFTFLSRLILILGVALPWSILGPRVTPVRADGPHSGPSLTPEQATAVALNDLSQSPEGYQLRHPRYTVNFTRQGLRLLPQGGGPAWSWQLAEVGGAQGEATIVPVSLNAIQPSPEATTAGRVVYERGGLVEQYMLGGEHVEQQFILSQPLLPPGVDLVIKGQVSSQGEFEAGAEGWSWRNAEGKVSLGQVRVFDATGKALPAWLEVTAGQTRLIVKGAGLATATYPVLIDPEIGTNDFRISTMGDDGNPDFDGGDSAIAYNSNDEQYLVVWYGNDDDTGGLANDEYEIFGQLLEADGDEIGSDFRISNMGPDGDNIYSGLYPSVAYNSDDNQYLVVWHGDTNTGGLVDNEFEIFGQFLNASGGTIGSDFQISNMGPGGNANFDAAYPDIVYNPTDNHYLVVWQGDHDVAPLVDNEAEIFGQLLNVNGTAVMTEALRLSDMGTDGVVTATVASAAVAYNSVENEYLVVWSGDDGGSQADDAFEIYGQRLHLAAGALEEIGADFRISDMGVSDTSQLFDANQPDVAYNPNLNQYLVVWQGDDDTSPLGNDEVEIFGRFVSESGVPSLNDFRISEMGGPNGSTTFGTFEPAVAYNSTVNEYMVVWRGDDDTLVNDEYEIFGRRFPGSGSLTGTSDERLSNAGTDGDTAIAAGVPAIVHNPDDNEYLITWHAERTDEEFEVYGQRYTTPAEMNVQGNGVSIADGDTTPTTTDHTQFPNVTLGQAFTRTFTIFNSSPTAALHLTGTPLVGITGPGAASFTLVTSPTTPIATSGNTTFQIRFEPTSATTQTATLVITNTDANENPYNFTIQGTGTNLAPTANAGPDQNVVVGTVAALDGSASSDPDGAGHLPLTYRWEQTGGLPNVSLSNPNASQPTFTAPGSAAVLTFSLVVTDSFGKADPTPDQVVITIKEHPTANAGPDQTKGATLLVTLNGTGSTDPNGESLTYRWDQTGGLPNVSLSNPNASQPTFTAPTDVAVLTFTLKVTNTFGLTDPTPDQVVVTITQFPPVANAGPNQTKGAGLLVTLNGTGSTDQDNHLPLTYRWTQIVGSSPVVTLSNATASQPTFTAPNLPTVLTFSLTVTDSLNKADDTPDEVVVTITQEKPVANAGPNQNVGTGLVATLNGSGSNDPDNHLPLTYRWTQTGGPNVTLSSATASQPTFTAPQATTALTFSLTVTDAKNLGSDPDVVIISVSDKTAPTKPTLITPTGGVALDIARPKFDWNDSTDTFGVTSYTLRLTGTTTVSSFVTTASVFTPTADLKGGAYSWTVIAHDAAGNSSTPATAASFSINTDVEVFLPLLVK